MSDPKVNIKIIIQRLGLKTSSVRLSGSSWRL